jgi:glucose/mannose-6-phosphate isomerase
MLPEIRKELEACSPQVPQASNRAKQIAVRLDGKIPFIYSSRNVQPAGRRWQTQINENSKMLCLYGELPEADHNQVVGWVDGARKPECQPVFLRASSDHGMMADIARATISIFEDFHLDPVLVDLEGSTSLENIMRGIVLGDHVSYYLAMLKGVDPAPVSSIRELKKRLG